MIEGEALACREPMLGDIVISIPTAARQANARQASLLDEVTMLLAHGLLHLLGFDHRTAFERRRMDSRLEYLIATI
jgi:probable rRNA maturation factor